MIVDVDVTVDADAAMTVDADAIMAVDAVTETVFLAEAPPAAAFSG